MRPLIRKERQLAIAALSVLLIATTYNSLISPALQRIDTLHRVIPEKQQELIGVTQTAHQAKQLQKQLGHLQQTITNQPKDFSPETSLTKIIRESNLSDHQTSLTQRQHPIDDLYTETTLTLELQAVTLKQLVTLLNHCQSQKPAITLQTTNITHVNAALNATLSFSHLAINPKN